MTFMIFDLWKKMNGPCGWMKKLFKETNPITFHKMCYIVVMPTLMFPFNR